MKTIKHDALKIVFIAFFFLSCSLSGLSQMKRGNGIFENWSINANFQINSFFGDISAYDSDIYNKIQYESDFGYGFIFTKELNRLWMIRGQLSFGKLQGTKEKSNLYFNGSITERNINLSLDLTNLFFPNNYPKTVSIYGFAGLGFLDFRSVLKESETNVIVSTQGYSSNNEGKSKQTTETYAPIGCGIKYNFADNWFLNIEGALKIINSDRVDAFAGGVSRDFYSNISIGIGYKYSGYYKGHVNKRYSAWSLSQKKWAKRRSSMYKRKKRSIQANVCRKHR